TDSCVSTALWPEGRAPLLNTYRWETVAATGHLHCQWPNCLARRSGAKAGAWSFVIFRLGLGKFSRLLVRAARRRRRHRIVGGTFAASAPPGRHGKPRGDGHRNGTKWVHLRRPSEQAGRVRANPTPRAVPNTGDGARGRAGGSAAPEAGGRTRA